MIINNFYARGTRGAVPPVEANPPLIVDADAVLSFSVSLQHLETVTGQGGDIAKPGSRLQAIQLQTGGSLDAGECLHPFAKRKIPGPLIAVTENHSSILYLHYALRKA